MSVDLGKARTGVAVSDKDEGFAFPKCVIKEKYVYMNPGSVSIPKEDSWHGYMTLENGVFLWKDIDGNIKHEYRFNGQGGQL